MTILKWIITILVLILGITRLVISCVIKHRDLGDDDPILSHKSVRVFLQVGAIVVFGLAIILCILE